MEDKGVFQTILRTFSTNMETEAVLGDQLSTEIIKLIEEDKCKRDILEKTLKTRKAASENY